MHKAGTQPNMSGRNTIFFHCFGTILKSVLSGTNRENHEKGTPPDIVEVGGFILYKARMLNKLFLPFGLSSAISAIEIQSSSKF